MNELLSYLESITKQTDTDINIKLIDNVLIVSEQYIYQGEYEWMRVFAINSRKNKTFILRVITNSSNDTMNELVMFHGLEAVKAYLKNLYS